MTNRITIRPVSTTGKAPEIYFEDYYFSPGYFEVARKSIATIKCEAV